MDISTPVDWSQWIDGVRRELATLTATPRAAAIETLSTRLAAYALSANAPRCAAVEVDCYQRHLITGGHGESFSALLIAWPARHRTPIHDHAGLWGIELVLDGALAIEEFSIGGDLDRPLPLQRRILMLGIGDSAVFTHHRYAHRCRNLSSTRPALSLHVYGGVLDRYHTFHADPRGRYRTQLQQAAIDTTLAV